MAPGRDYVKVNWTHPKYEPDRYQIKYVCTMKPKYTLSSDTLNYVTTNMQNLSSDTTSFTIFDLRPSSICVLILLAVYNPASIDTGIAIKGATLDEVASKTNSGLFSRNKFVNVYFLFSII